MVAPRVMLFAGALLFAQAWIVRAGPGDAGLAPGVFLYAAPGLQAGVFAESVVLLVRHEEKGSLGLIVNKPTGVKVREAVTELGELHALDLALYLGGPVERRTILALVRRARSLDEGLRVLPDVYFSTRLDHLKEAALRPEAESRLRVYAGYSGWGPGQLEAELRARAWVVGPATAASIFSSEPEALWPRVHDLLRRMQVGAPPADRPGEPAPRSLPRVVSFSASSSGAPSLAAPSWPAPAGSACAGLRRARACRPGCP